MTFLFEKTKQYVYEGDANHQVGRKNERTRDYEK